VLNPQVCFFVFQSPWVSNLFSLCHQLARVPQLSYITVTPTLVLIRLRAPTAYLQGCRFPYPIEWMIRAFVTSKGAAPFLPRVPLLLPRVSRAPHTAHCSYAWILWQGHRSTLYASAC
jgi:hypothetical protein